MERLIHNGPAICAGQEPFTAYEIARRRFPTFGEYLVSRIFGGPVYAS
jgi:hypothetical protein